MRYRTVCICFVLLCATWASAADKITIDELIMKHRDSVGTPEARRRMNVIYVAGTSNFQGLSSAGAKIDGTLRMASQGDQFVYESQFETPLYYNGEKIGWDGHNVTAATFGINRVSQLAIFFNQYPMLVREGLFGGVLNHAWELNYLKQHDPKLRFDGLKKFNGAPALQVWCNPKKSPAEITIKLFFDPASYRHIGTQYLYKEIPLLEERFSDFTDIEGLTLPKRWELYYTDERTGYTLRWINLLNVIKPMPELPRQQGGK